MGRGDAFAVVAACGAAVSAVAIARTVIVPMILALFEPRR